MTFKQSLKPQNSYIDPYITMGLIGSESKAMIIEAISYANNEATIEQIQEMTDISYHAIYQHLRTMEGSRIIQSFRDGRERIYSIDVRVIDKLQSWFKTVSHRIHKTDNY